jgi:hypothetical protein
MSDTKRAPIEVWLRFDGKRVLCAIVNPDESVYPHDIASPSLRGAQREVGGYLIGNGFWPDGLWTVEAKDDNGAAVESWRRFTPP